MGIDLIPPTPDSVSVSDPPIVRPMPVLQATGRVGQPAGGIGQHGIEMVAEADLTIPTHHDAEHPYYAVHLRFVRDVSWRYADDGSSNDPFVAFGESLHSATPPQSDNEFWRDPNDTVISDLGGPSPSPLIGASATHYAFELTHDAPCDRLTASPYLGRRATAAPGPFGPPVDPPASTGPTGSTPPNYELGPDDLDPSGWPYWFLAGLGWAEYDIVFSGSPGSGVCTYPAHVANPPTPLPRFFNDNGDGWLLPVNAYPRLYWRIVATVPELWVNAAWAEITPFYWREDIQVPGLIAVGAATSGTRRRRGPIIGAQG